MASFLSGSSRGWVHRIQSPAGSIGAIVSNVNINQCLITRVAIAEQSNVQFSHSLGNHIFVYVFGDRIGEMSVAGLAYFDCNTGNHGISNAIQWYRSQRVAKTGSKVSVTVSDTNLQGYLTAFRADTQQVESGLLEFLLSFALIPSAS